MKSIADQLKELHERVEELENSNVTNITLGKDDYLFMKVPQLSNRVIANIRRDIKKVFKEDAGRVIVITDNIEISKITLEEDSEKDIISTYMKNVRHLYKKDKIIL